MPLNVGGVRSWGALPVSAGGLWPTVAAADDDNDEADDDGKTADAEERAEDWIFCIRTPGKRLKSNENKT